MSPDEAFLNVRGSTRLFGPAPNFVRQIKRPAPWPKRAVTRLYLVTSHSHHRADVKGCRSGNAARQLGYVGPGEKESPR